jgi:hypothetical protein
MLMGIAARSSRRSKGIFPPPEASSPRRPRKIADERRAPKSAGDLGTSASAEEMTSVVTARRKILILERVSEPMVARRV